MKHLYTYGSVSIENGKVSLEGEPVFESPTVPLELFLTKVYEGLNISYPKFYKMDLISKLGFLASEWLIAQLPWIQGISKEKVALCLQTQHGSLDTDLHYLENIRDKEEYFPSPSVFVYTLPNIAMGEICIRNGFKGENMCLASDGFNVSLAHTILSDWMELDQTEICLLAWLDVSPTRYSAFITAIGTDLQKSKGSFPETIGNG